MMRMGLAWKIYVIILIAIVTSSWTTSAIAQNKTSTIPKCKPIYSTGLEDGGRKFHAYSICMKTRGQFTPKYKLRYKVCAPPSSDLGFRWQELRWVSGSNGIPPKSCMSYYLDSNKFGILESSTVNTTRGDGRLGIYMPVTKGEERFVAIETEIAGGSINSYYLVRIEAHAGYDGVSFDARVIGKDVKLIVLLPPAIVNADDLVQQGIINREQLDAFREKLVRASEYLDQIISEEDAEEHWMKYANELQFQNRLAIPIPETDGVALQTFIAEPGQIKDIDILFNIIVCVSARGKLNQCFGIPNDGGS